MYEDRHDVNPQCLPLADAIQKGILPKACPYVCDMANYVGPQVLPSDVYSQLKPHIQKSLNNKPAPAWIDDATWKAFMSSD